MKMWRRRVDAELYAFNHGITMTDPAGMLWVGSSYLDGRLPDAGTTTTPGIFGRGLPAGRGRWSWDPVPGLGRPGPGIWIPPRRRHPAGIAVLKGAPGGGLTALDRAGPAMITSAQTIQGGAMDLFIRSTGVPGKPCWVVDILPRQVGRTAQASGPS